MRKGFTLIELLVAITIIAIVISFVSSINGSLDPSRKLEQYNDCALNNSEEICERLYLPQPSYIYETTN